MKYIYTILFTFALMLFVSCTKDDLTPDTTGKEVTLVVPVSVVGELSIADASFTRTTSDPGVDDKLTLPQNLYIWVCLQTDSRVGYEKVSVSYRHYEINGAPYSWIDNDHIQLSVSLPEIDETSTSVPVGQIYAIASSRALSDGELNGIFNEFSTTEYHSGYCIKSKASTTFNLLDDAVFTPATALTSDQLRDLYSTPTANILYVKTVTDDKAVELETHNAGNVVKLYHCAAKADFQWEVSLDNTSIKKIQLTGLPTECKIFAPAQNTALKENGIDANTDGSCYLISDDAENDVAPNYITEGNKYIGRACAYVLQPAAGSLSYTVTFDGGKSPVSVTSATLDNPSATNTTYTTWYRIRANITNP